MAPFGFRYSEWTLDPARQRDSVLSKGARIDVCDVASTVRTKEEGREAVPDCQYADANDRGIHTTLCLVEATGALCPELVADLRQTAT